MEVYSGSSLTPMLLAMSPTQVVLAGQWTGCAMALVICSGLLHLG